jgi:uncharacterized membrane protein YbhN (UPF0104 family)
MRERSESMRTTVETNTKRITKSVIKVLIVLVIFYFLGKNLYQNWWQIDFKQLHFNVPLLIVSILFLFIYFLLFVFGWKLILKRLGVSLSFLKALKIIFYSQLGKYLPGKIWVFVGRIYFCQQLGIPTSKTFLSIVLELAVAIISGTLIFLVALSIFPGTQIHINPFFLMIVVVILFIIIHPKVLTRIINIFLHLVKKGSIKIDLNFSQICGIIMYYCIVWLSFGIATIGAMALFVPGGLGVREGVLALLLNNFFPISLAILLSILSRIWISFGEFILIGISTRIKL